eukprot:TRINITY_DN5184_c0_g1_i13.p1 TRINITY_DN5184_c0_g1~~TRINITY_DN5184_c0_g1_i13.p1  ORF type:complete len:158 (-),score=29.11 TRINITY_DN5184_c0_g1_i13:126-599(-)
MGQFRLGFMLYHGKGVTEDKVSGIELFRRSADHGNPLALEELGWIYSEGKFVEKDIPRAINLYKQAAEGGNLGAMYTLGLIYTNGNAASGIKPDLEQAKKYFDLASANGHVSAQNRASSIGGPGVKTKKGRRKRRSNTSETITMTSEDIIIDRGIQG